MVGRGPAAIAQGDEEGIDERVLPLDTGVRYAVRQHHPRRPGREGEPFVGWLLERRRVLHPVVEPPHAAIVGRAVDHPRHRKRLARQVEQTREHAFRERRLQRAFADAGVLRVAVEQFLERPLADPDPGPRRVQVDEEAQDAIAVGRAVGARVHVDELVARVWRKAAAPFLHGAEAGGPGRPAAGEAGHGAPEEFPHLEPMLAQDPLRAVAHQSGRLDARQLLRAGVVADVLATEEWGQTLAEKPLIIRRWKRYRALREVNDAALLQRVRPIAAVGLVQHETREASTAAPLCVEKIFSIAAEICCAGAGSMHGRRRSIRAMNIRPILIGAGVVAFGGYALYDYYGPESKHARELMESALANKDKARKNVYLGALYRLMSTKGWKTTPQLAQMLPAETDWEAKQLIIEYVRHHRDAAARADLQAAYDKEAELQEKGLIKAALLEIDNPGKCVVNDEGRAESGVCRYTCTDINRWFGVPKPKTGCALVTDPPAEAQQKQGAAPINSATPTAAGAAK